MMVIKLNVTTCTEKGLKKKHNFMRKSTQSLSVLEQGEYFIFCQLIVFLCQQVTGLASLRIFLHSQFIGFSGKRLTWLTAQTSLEIIYLYQ